MTTKPRASTRYLLTCAVLGVAGGLLTVTMNWISLSFATVGLIFIGVTIGSWLLAPMVALALLQRPGAGLLVAVLAGLVNIPFTVYGAAQMPTVIVSGLLVELPFAITLYRRWNAWIFYAGLGTLITIGSTAWFIAVDGFATVPWLPVALYAATAVASLGFVWLARLIAAKLRKAGVGTLPAKPARVPSAAPAASATAESDR